MVNIDCIVGVRLVGAIVFCYGNVGFEGLINFIFNGSVG